MTASPRRAMRGMFSGGWTLEAFTGTYCPGAVSPKRAEPRAPAVGLKRFWPRKPFSPPHLLTTAVDHRLVGLAQVVLGVNAPPLGDRQQPGVQRPAIGPWRALVF